MIVSIVEKVSQHYQVNTDPHRGDLEPPQRNLQWQLYLQFFFTMRQDEISSLNTQRDRKKDKYIDLHSETILFGIMKVEKDIQS